jgi:hypothetical protein
LSREAANARGDRRGELKIIMIIERVEKSHGKNRTRAYRLLSVLAAIAFALTIYAGKANAQVIGDLVANIPFEFHAGNAKFPAGEYRIHVLDDSDLSVMEIQSVNGSASALFEVQETETKSTPTQSELIFNRYGDKYFLADLFDQGNPSGSEVLKSRYEKRMNQQAMLAQAHVPAKGQAQRGK